MSEEVEKVEVTKEYFDRQISQKCARVREISLRVLNLNLQVSDLEDQLRILNEERRELLVKSSTLFEEIRKLVDMAKTFLNLKGIWFCALDEGKMLPSKDAEDQSV